MLMHAGQIWPLSSKSLRDAYFLGILRAVLTKTECVVSGRSSPGQPLLIMRQSQRGNIHMSLCRLSPGWAYNQFPSAHWSNLLGLVSQTIFVSHWQLFLLLSEVSPGSCNRHKCNSGFTLAELSSPDGISCLRGTDKIKGPRIQLMWDAPSAAGYMVLQYGCKCMCFQGSGMQPNKNWHKSQFCPWYSSQQSSFALPD